jgi:hypothetical protein
MIVHKVVRRVSPLLKKLGTWDEMRLRSGIETSALIKPKISDVTPIQINPRVAL